VSTRTVSRVVNREPGISEGTRRRVQDAVTDLGYRPNFAARRLVTRKSDLVGLVLPLLDNPFFPSLAVGVQQACRERGETVVLGQTLGEATIQSEIFESLVSHGVDGMIAMPEHGTDADLAMAVDAGIPVVTVNVDTADERVGTVMAAFEQGARLVAEHFSALGHERAAVVANASDPSGLRERAFVDRMLALGNPEPIVVYANDATIDEGIRQGRWLLRELPDVTAVFAYNDLLAIGVIRACAEAGVEVPGGMSVVGFDDIDLAQQVTPALSTVAVDRAELGRQAVQLLDRIARGQTSSRAVVEVPAFLQVRESSAAPTPRPDFRDHAAERVTGPEPA
jgi:LacI family transcriptional regulator